VTPEVYQAWLKRQATLFEFWVNDYYQDTVRWDVPFEKCGIYQSYWDLWLYKPPETK
jgi:hypothetical protein